jgi:hypothetical protein
MRKKKWVYVFLREAHRVEGGFSVDENEECGNKKDEVSFISMVNNEKKKKVEKDEELCSLFEQIIQMIIRDDNIKEDNDENIANLSKLDIFDSKQTPYSFSNTFTEQENCKINEACKDNFIVSVNEGFFFFSIIYYLTFFIFLMMNEFWIRFWFNSKLCCCRNES